MNQQVFDFDDARNDEESIGGYNLQSSNQSKDKTKKAPRSASVPVRDDFKNSVENDKNIDIKIELEANSSGSEDAFTDRA